MTQKRRTVSVLLCALWTVVAVVRLVVSAMGYPGNPVSLVVAMVAGVAGVVGLVAFAVGSVRADVGSQLVDDPARDAGGAA